MRFTKDYMQEIDIDREELAMIMNARLGMSEDFDTLFNRYWPLVRKIWQQYHVTDLELDDWIQESQLVMVRVLKSYEGNNIGKFSGFYKQSLVNRILDIYRARQAHKRIPAAQLAPLDKDCFEIADQHQGIPDDIVYCHHCLEEFMQDCSAFERQVVALLHAGNNLGEIAECLHCNERKVQSALTRSRRKLIKAIRMV